MDYDLSGRVVAITGASSGIGEATALMCAKAGASVALGARRSERIEALAAQIDESGGVATAIPVDITSEQQAMGFVRTAHERLGRLDVLINNAGVMLLGPVEGADTENWRRMIEVNCLGLLYCTHAALPLMREQGSGHIVNVASVAGRRASLGSGVYNMTKWGVVGFSEALRQEALHANIRVTVVEPGFVETELLDPNAQYVQDAATKIKEEIGEVLRSEDIADAIVHALAAPAHVSINEVLVRPTAQRT